MGGEAVTDDDFPTTAMRQKAGHQEILGETLAKFEFFQKGWHPYSRFLDIDKVDLILRRRLADKIVYREVQVKFGKLHTSMSAWEHKLFTCSSWRFFTEKDLDDMTERVGLFLVYVLSRDEGFKGDMLIFPINDFVKIARSSHKSGNGKYKVYISQSLGDDPRWYVRRQDRKFDTLNDKTVVDVTHYYRNFQCLQ
jgi:hypothetical protein